MPLVERNSLYSTSGRFFSFNEVSRSPHKIISIAVLTDSETEKVVALVTHASPPINRDVWIEIKEPCIAS